MNTAPRLTITGADRVAALSAPRPTTHRCPHAPSPAGRAAAPALADEATWVDLERTLVARAAARAAHPAQGRLAA